MHTYIKNTQFHVLVIYLQYFHTVAIVQMICFLVTWMVVTDSYKCLHTNNHVHIYTCMHACMRIKLHLGTIHYTYYVTITSKLTDLI